MLIPPRSTEARAPRGLPLRGAAMAASGLFALLAAGPSPAGAATSCHRVASPAGSDAAAGTLESPYRSAAKLVGSLAPGQTGCFRAGTYSFGTLSLGTAQVTLAPYGAERATLAGHLKLLPGAHHSVIEGLTLDASSSPDNQSGPKIYASNVVLRDNEITNRHTGICIIVGAYYSDPAPGDILIERNRIHDCGVLPATNYHHGIYLSEARGVVIRDNWIYDNADRGIQQYPDVTGTVITGNVIAGNGDGVNFSGSGSEVTRNATVWGNVVVDSRLGYNAYSGGDGPNGTNNYFSSNCVHALGGGTGIEPRARSFNASANLLAAPQFVNAAADDYRLQPGSQCLAKYSGTMSGPGAGTPPVTGRQVRLKVNRRSVRGGRRVKLRGSVKVADSGAQQVAIQRRIHGGWHRVGTTRIRPNQRFAKRLRVRGRRVSKYRALVPGVGHSRVVRVRVRDRRR